MKKSIRFFAVVMTAAMLFAAVLSCVSCTATESPKALFQKAISRTADKMEKIDIVNTAEKIASGGSIELKGEGLEFGEDSDSKGEFSLVLYANKDKKTAAAVLNAKIGEEKYEGALYGSENAIVAKFDKILGKNAYGINLSKAGKNLAKSVFAEDSDSKFSLSEEDYAKLEDVVKNINELKSAEKDAEKLYDKYVKKLYKLISDNAEYEKENTTTSVFDEKDVACTLVTVKLSSSALTKVIESFWKDAKSDTQLKKFINDRIIALVDEYDDAGDLYDDIDDYVEKAAEQIDNSSVSVTVRYFLNKSSGAIMKADVALRANGEKTTVGVELGKTHKTFEGFKFTVRNGSDDPDYLWIRVIEDTKEQLRCEVLTTRMFSLPEITLKYTKDDGAVKITVAEEDYFGEKDETTVKLNYKKKGSVHTVVLESISQNGEKIDIPFSGKYSVIVNTSAKAPSAPSKYTDILTMNEETFEDFVEEVQNNLEEAKESVPLD